MNKDISYVSFTKNKTHLGQFQIRIDIENKFILDKLLKSRIPFTVTGKKKEECYDKKFEVTKFAERVQGLLEHSWETLIKKIENILEMEDKRLDNIAISIISSGPHIIPVFQYSYYYNGDEDYGHDVFNTYIATQYVEECYNCWTGEPIYLPTRELSIEFNLDLEKKYKQKYIFKNITSLNYRT